MLASTIFFDNLQIENTSIVKYQSGLSEVKTGLLDSGLSVKRTRTRWREAANQEEDELIDNSLEKSRDSRVITAESGFLKPHRRKSR